MIKEDLSSVVGLPVPLVRIMHIQVMRHLDRRARIVITRIIHYLHGLLCRKEFKIAMWSLKKNCILDLLLVGRLRAISSIINTLPH